MLESVITIINNMTFMNEVSTSKNLDINRHNFKC